MSLSFLKKPTTAVLFLMTLCTIPAFSQSSREILSNYRKALGKTIDDSYFQSLELEGSFAMQKMEIPTVLYFKTPDRTRLEMKFQGISFLKVTNDTLEWTYSEFDDKNEVKTRQPGTGFGTPDENEQGFDIVSHHLMKFDEAKDKIVISKSKLDSLDVFVLEIFKNKAKEVTAKVYLNRKTFLINKIEDEHGSRYFADYYHKDGIVFPRFIQNVEPDQTMVCRFTKLMINQPIADSLFVIPNDALEKDKIAKEAVNKEGEACDALYNQGEYDKAFTCYDKLIAKNKESYFGYNGRGLVKIERGEFYDAIVDLTKALEIEPKGSAARSNRGLAKYYLNDYEGAIKDYTKALEYNPDYTTAIKNRGMANIALEKYEESLKDFEAAIKKDEQDGDSYLWHGFSLAQLEKYEEALASYQQSARLGTKSGDLFNYKGVTEYQLQQYDSSKVSFARAMRFNEKNNQYIENYARSLFQLDENEKAMEFFQRCINNNHDLPDMYNMLGLCKYHEENYKGAIKDFSKSIELDGKNPTVFDNRASAKEHIEDYTGAIQDYSESIRIYPTDAEVFYKRGLLKIRTSNKIEGCLDLSTAHDMKYEPAKEAIYKHCN